jgi:SAM-dependent methyltransferase
MNMDQLSETNAMTIEYYDKNSEKYFEDTVNLDMERHYSTFLELIPDRAAILDAGCGSGRDTLYFRKKGYSVVAFDYSAELVKKASEFTGENILHLSFKDIQWKEEFDGIWACASLLHVPKKDIDDVFDRLADALKRGGVLFASFKLGEGEDIKKERLFNYYTESTMRILIQKHPRLVITRIWITEDVRDDRKGEYWLNMLLKKD